jgi:hypothetical protein
MPVLTAADGARLHFEDEGRGAAHPVPARPHEERRRLRPPRAAPPRPSDDPPRFARAGPVGVDGARDLHRAAGGRGRGRSARPPRHRTGGGDRHLARGDRGDVDGRRRARAPAGGSCSTTWAR